MFEPPAKGERATLNPNLSTRLNLLFSEQPLGGGLAIAGRPLWVQHGPDTLEMRCLYYPQKQTSISHAADCDVIARYGGAKPTDEHLASKIHCVDDGIIGWLERREQLRRNCQGIWRGGKADTIFGFEKEADALHWIKEKSQAWLTD